ncbi:MAG: PAS domain S-box protein [Deltaproteobacteria bacterium]|nr:PAS domain S-box protein [Deltaproteobacteria bacterium]
MMTPAAAAARRILLIEDNPGDAALIVELLGFDDRSFVLVHVERLSAGLARLREAHFDAVILDLRLPDATGLDTVRAIRAETEDTPMVVLTGLADEALALACLEAGAQDYLEKDHLPRTDLRRSLGYALARSHEAAQRRRADALQRHLATIVESSPDGIVSINAQGDVTSWNRGAERIFGFAATEVVGRPFGELLSPPTDAPAHAEELALVERTLAGEDGVTVELSRVRRDGVPVVISVVTCRITDERGQTTGLAAICRDVTEARGRDAELRRRNHELEQREQQMRALTIRLNQVREEERTRLSRAVHDELGQLLTGLKMDLRWITRRLPDDAPPWANAIAQRVGEAEGLTDKLLRAIQRIAIELRPSALDALGLASAVRDEARRFEERSGIPTDVEVSGAEVPPAEVATVLFRVLQELLTNVARHAQASLVTVDLALGPDAFRLQVQDDGVGIPADAEGRPGSLGLLGIREQVSVYAGSVEFRGVPGTGTTVTVRVPQGS